MKIVTLTENTCGFSGCIAEHGLSLYIEAGGRRLLMDTGQTDALLHNAGLLGIDLRSVGTVILSHGHYDHSGGILPLLRIAPHVRIYMQQSAAEPHYHGERYIGIAPQIASLPNVCMLQGDLDLGGGMYLFSGIRGRRCRPEGNRQLSRISGGRRLPDDFAHEQCLVIEDGGRHWLFSGCAHNGILNILDRYRELFGRAPDCVVSGFHMMKSAGEYTDAERETVIQTANVLAATDTVYYTGHCTGAPAFALMQQIMGDRLRALHSGTAVSDG